MYLSPKEIVAELDKHIIGQKEAKKAVAVALRNRWRRQQVKEPLRSEITPKNILLIGPTGVGKTEIARRLARLSGAPFVKVEATKFTEVGYVGKDVDSIIRDLVEIAVKDHRDSEREKHYEKAKYIAEERILDILLPAANSTSSQININSEVNDSSTRERFRDMLRQGQLNDKEVELEVSYPKSGMGILLGPPGLEELTNQIQSMFDNTADTGKKKKRKMKIVDALEVLKEEEASKLVDEDDVKVNSIRNVEQNGIVFIDEIDKVAIRGESRGAEVSRAGVQRDLLPLVEGTTVSTKYGMVKTDHILFIASGAFHLSKPSDLLPELQGRFPIRVELSSLTISDFESILTETESCLTEQYKALLETDNANIEFTKDAITKMAEIAFNVNEKTENIGARRLYTIIEKLVEDISYTPENYSKVSIDAKFVEDKLGVISQSEDLSRYIL
ncbi:MAG: ATP-dependent protease ATPase subunit HslU [Neisseriaceae bacterium]